MQLTKRSSAIVVVEEGGEGVRRAEEGGEGVRRAEELVEGGAGVTVEDVAEVAWTARRGQEGERD